MEKKSLPLPESKFKFLYFLPKAITPSEPSTRTPTPRLKKKKKKRTARSASMSVKNNGSFRFRGPRSPKVFSCIGYVVNKGNKKRRKEEKKKRKNGSKGNEHLNAVGASRSNSSLHILELLKIFMKKVTKLANPYEESSSYSPPGAVHQKSVPKLGNAKKFFEWRVHDSSGVALDRPSTLSTRRKEKRNGAVVVEIENIVLVPRKEINLWKKRKVAPPPLLRV